MNGVVPFYAGCGSPPIRILYPMLVSFKRLTVNKLLVDVENCRYFRVLVDVKDQASWLLPGQLNVDWQLLKDWFEIMKRDNDVPSQNYSWHLDGPCPRQSKAMGSSFGDSLNTSVALVLSNPATRTQPSSRSVAWR